MRWHPRGIPRSAYEEWYRDLGPSPDLLRAWRSGKISWEAFSQRYRAQIPEDSGARETLIQLIQRARRETLVLLCTCREESRCHRILLRHLMEEGLP